MIVSSYLLLLRVSITSHACPNDSFKHRPIQGKPDCEPLLTPKRTLATGYRSLSLLPNNEKEKNEAARSLVVVNLDYLVLSTLPAHGRPPASATSSIALYSL